VEKVNRKIKTSQIPERERKNVSSRASMLWEDFGEHERKEGTIKRKKRTFSSEGKRLNPHDKTKDRRERIETVALEEGEVR